MIYIAKDYTWTGVMDTDAQPIFIRNQFFDSPKSRNFFCLEMDNEQANAICETVLQDGDIYEITAKKLEAK